MTTELAVATIAISTYGGPLHDLAHTVTRASKFHTLINAARRFFYRDGEAHSGLFRDRRVDATGDDEAIEAVHLVYFVGHGQMRGPIFSGPVAGNRDDQAPITSMRLGDRSLRYVVFDACEVLKSHEVFERWDFPVFAGARGVLGFSSLAAAGSTERGAIFAAYLNEGMTLRDAWRLACQETEASGRCWAMVRVEVDGDETLADVGAALPTAGALREPAALVYEEGGC